MVNPLVVDVSHYDKITDLQAARRFGIAGIIAKATQGTSFVDGTYPAIRRKAAAAGMLFGAYHFLERGHVEEQVAHFLAVAKPDDETLLALDHEPYGAKTPTLEDARHFCELIAAKVGRKPVIYSGNLIKEQLAGHVDNFFSGHRLWLAQYGSKPVTQRSWAAPWLHQYTGDGVGPEPHNIPGISIPGGRGIDINSFDGDEVKLRVEWLSDPALPISTIDQPAHGVLWLQQSLNALGASPRVKEDGDIGPKTIAAVREFQRKAGLKVDGVAGPLTTASIEARLLKTSTAQVQS
jgi:GH25 family lysozyme M1 (1,4-beta-N-acetylmuramidase)